MPFRGFTKEYLNADGSSIREDLLGGKHTEPNSIEVSVLKLRMQHRIAGFTGVFGDNKDDIEEDGCNKDNHLFDSGDSAT